MSFLQRIRVLPLLVIVAMLSFAVRLGEVAVGITSGSAFAQEKTDEPVPPLPGKEEAAAKTEEKPAAKEAVKEEAATANKEDAADVAKDAAKDAVAAEEKPATEEANGPEWRDASETEYEYSEVRAELFRDLSKRREEIEAKEKAMAAREALLLAAERELDSKLRELTALRGEIEGLLKKQSDEEKARIASLVSIYEGMKAKDAARIFNTLDMDVLLSVMGQMSERKSAPILAEMNPERARSITILMAQENKLPELPPQ